MNAFFDYLLLSIAFGMTFLFGCTGEIITEKAGHLNLGIPGIMCVGGAAGCAAIWLLGMFPIPVHPVLIVLIAILASFIGGMLMGALYSFLAVTLKANQNVTGLAMTTFGVGVTKFIMAEMAKDPMKYLYALDYFRFPFASQTTALKYYGVMVLLAVVIALVTAFVLYRTRIGLHLRAVGENPATADAAGINITLYKYLATCIGSGVAALGGLFYIMDYMGSVEAYKTIEPLGWLAVALVIFTLWRPHLSVFGSVIFGALFFAGSHLPIMLNINLDMSIKPFLQMLPYVVTIIVLIITSVRKKKENQPPASLGLSYFREDR